MVVSLNSRLESNKEEEDLRQGSEVGVSGCGCGVERCALRVWELGFGVWGVVEG